MLTVSTWKVWLLLALVGLLLMACARQADTAAPPEIAYGEDVCDRCKMIISEERFAAAYWTTAGEARRFDDIGGMVATYLESGDDVASFWVHDYVSGEWLAAEMATYVLDSRLHTPMGFGVAACADDAQAEALAYGEEGAMVLSWSELLAHSAGDGMAAEHGH